MADITTEAEFNAAPVGTVMRDRNKDVWVKDRPRGAEQNGVVGTFSASWIAYPAEILDASTDDTSTLRQPPDIRSEEAR